MNYGVNNETLMFMNVS